MRFPASAFGNLREISLFQQRRERNDRGPGADSPPPAANKNEKKKKPRIGLRSSKVAFVALPLARFLPRYFLIADRRESWPAVFVR